MHTQVASHLITVIIPMLQHRRVLPAESVAERAANLRANSCIGFNLAKILSCLPAVVSQVLSGLMVTI